MDTNIYTAIEHASNFALACNGFVYNLKTKKRLKRNWSKMVWNTRVVNDDGDYVRVSHSRLDARTGYLPPDTYRPVSHYPDYDVTPYGAIWRVRNLNGPKGKNPYMVYEELRYDKRYAKLRSKFGKWHKVRVELVVERAYP